MSLTIRDCLQLPSLSLGSIIAGHKGLDNIVNTVSVVEFDIFDDALYTPNELLITAFYSVRDNVAAQCEALEEYKKSGDVGMVLFYSASILKIISPLVMETADRLNFPIIAMPGENIGIRYSDVIGDVMEAIVMDRKNNNFFVNNTMERIAQLSQANRNITMVLSFASEYTKASFFLCDDKNNLIAVSYWPFSSKLDFNVVLHSTVGNSEYNIYQMPFTNRNGTKLTLYAASKNNKLNTRIMNEIIEVIQLFSVIWNYNLNISTRESLIPALLDGDVELAGTIATEQNMNIDALNTAIFVDLDDCDSNGSRKPLVVSDIRSIFIQNGSNDIVDLFGNLIVLLMSCSRESTRDTILLNDILAYFEAEEECLNYALFANLDVESGVKEIYLEYCDSIDTARKIYPTKHSFDQSEIEFAYKCKKVINSIGNEKKSYIKILSSIIEDPEEDLLLTLSTYLLDADSQVKQTAELLFVHRNTVQYRLAKIKKLIGLDFSRMPVYYEVYFAVAVLRVMHP